MTSRDTKAWHEQLWQVYSYDKLALLFLYMLFGVATNCVVMLVYSKHKKLTGRVFILCLAIIDIVACLFILPQTPVFVNHAQFESLQTYRIIYGIETMVLIQSYLFAQVAMSLDQFVAVYFPFKHRKFGPKLKKIMLVAAVSTVGGLSVHRVLSSATDLSNVPVWSSLYSVVYRLVMSLSFLTLLVVYPLIVLKLYRQHRKVCPKPFGTSVVSGTIHEAAERTTAATVQLPTRQLQVPEEARHQPIEAETALTATEERGRNLAAASVESGRCTPGVMKPHTRRAKAQSKATQKMHVQAIKVYSSIFLLFTVSLFSLVMIILTNSLVLAYVYSLNHVGNPIIYYVFVPKFREAVNRYCKTLKFW